ncbi:MAG: (2Fe-2S)-binding protein [Gammaproteobacteria bacterium]|nr:(2Fe-2S)-binding protein [Gammaproteobacteria bacterium]
MLLQCSINGKRCELEIEPTTSLLDVLREQQRLTGTHMGCMTGHCGACTVLIDGRVAKSCITPAASVQRRKITTIEGLAAADGSLSPVQQAFWDEAGFQCGYCAPGMLLSVVELLEENDAPEDDDIRRAIAGNLCRCTGYQSIVRAARTAAARLRESRAD